MHRSKMPLISSLRIAVNDEQSTFAGTVGYQPHLRIQQFASRTCHLNHFKLNILINDILQPFLFAAKLFWFTIGNGKFA